MDALKSWRLDGLVAHFYQTQCGIVGISSGQMVEEFFSTRHLTKESNATNIVLIPKSSNLESFKSFSPICLCNVH
ncbi:hypothetical protein Scep_029839 [Stephania cephalantha]|uniref:Uncharacterized protein n=1 Tax=Stephania cephalantha TaxID=152367 RepID=A0AAP0HCN7_9MAGN